MNDRTEVLLHFYEEHAAQSRQHESQRERLTHLVLFACAAGFGLIAKFPDERSSLIIAIFIVVFGALSFFLSLKHYERNRLHVSLMDQAQRAIDSELGLAPHPGLDQMSLSELREEAERTHYENHRIRRAPERKVEKTAHWLCRWRLHRIWAAIPLVLAGFGLLTIAFLLERGVRLWGDPAPSEPVNTNETVVIIN